MMLILYLIIVHKIKKSRKILFFINISMAHNASQLIVVQKASLARS